MIIKNKNLADDVSDNPQVGRRNEHRREWSVLARQRRQPNIANAATSGRIRTTRDIEPSVARERTSVSGTEHVITHITITSQTPPVTMNRGIKWPHASILSEKETQTLTYLINNGIPISLIHHCASLVSTGIDPHFISTILKEIIEEKIMQKRCNRRAHQSETEYNEDDEDEAEGGADDTDEADDIIEEAEDDEETEDAEETEEETDDEENVTEDVMYADEENEYEENQNDDIYEESGIDEETYQAVEAEFEAGEYADLEQDAYEEESEQEYEYEN